VVQCPVASERHEVLHLPGQPVVGHPHVDPSTPQASPRNQLRLNLEESPMRLGVPPGGPDQPSPLQLNAGALPSPAQLPPSPKSPDWLQGLSPTSSQTSNDWRSQWWGQSWSPLRPTSPLTQQAHPLSPDNLFSNSTQTLTDWSSEWLGLSHIPPPVQQGHSILPCDAIPPQGGAPRQ
jgi:hypothetical protein